MCSEPSLIAAGIFVLSSRKLFLIVFNIRIVCRHLSHGRFVTWLRHRILLQQASQGHPASPLQAKIFFGKRGSNGQGMGDMETQLCNYDAAASWAQPWKPIIPGNWNWNLEAQVSISGPTPFGSLGISGRRASSTVVYTPQQDLRTSKLGRQRQ